VDDGSTDGTADVAAMFGVLILSQENQGKGRAMDLGVKASRADVIFFCDADVRGITPQIIQEILDPVLSGQADMMVGACYRRIYFIRSLFWIIPLLSGERAVTRELWDQVPADYKDRFMIETALNFYARHHGRGFQFKVFNDMEHTVKEKKYGFWAGFGSRLKMFWEIVSAQVSLLWSLHK
jgi:glycosyltransferase involved in cell wall biosynthesis